jgi:hypothetical protein
MNTSYKESPKEIIEELLKYHSVETLRGYINSATRKKQPYANNYLVVATSVYLIRNEHGSKLTWAIDTISNTLNIADNTVKSHLTKFRNEVKDRLKKLPQHAKLYGASVDKVISEYANMALEHHNKDNLIYFECEEILDNLFFVPHEPDIIF